MNNDTAIHIFGEVLFDHFPDGSRVLGGAPFNVAWHLQAFGQAPRFISRIGNDPSGHEVAALMDSWGMNKKALQIDPDHPTGSVQVMIEDGEPSYEIVADCAYDFIDEKLLDTENTDGFLYHGSLAIRNPAAHAALQAIKARHLGKIFIDVNLRSPWWHRDTLLPLLQDAAWLKLNEAELDELCPGHATLESAMQACCTQLDLDGLIVTLGAKGAIACEKNQDFVVAKPPASTKVVDTVGAGDAFSAILLLGLSNRWPLDMTLERAQIFASTLVGRRGATIADVGFYREFSEHWR
ncbi:MAG: carbohydrate kinase [Methylococcaceae bacterium]|nr:carbohydrate kinase [Methylococcaceae bacterium]MDP2394588.1 carbohydrate kinase [Methylococcaceae bacterium]MDP3019056.1 carbohydrate kinase [Methylococcaceae bacterium]MDP3390272.1 carbohydrate kinase [Methylococcaceae bacterium]MDZ4156327.1 carbohydrate kinase [Methylococcales bacterium]